MANDLDVQRCNLLIHQTKRMCTANLIVTNNEAQHFPGCRADKNGSKASEMEIEPQISQLLFDRVLCDVPCSGDGTLRKAPDMWRKWLEFLCTFSFLCFSSIQGGLYLFSPLIQESRDGQWAP